MRLKRFLSPKLRSSQLTLLRNNLRLIIKLALIEELRKLEILEGLYLRLSYKGLAPSQKKRFLQLSHKIDDLRYTFINSICTCASNSPYRLLKTLINKRMVRIPIISELDIPYKHNKDKFFFEYKWYCIDCFKDRKKAWFEDFKTRLTEMEKAHTSFIVIRDLKDYLRDVYRY